jgi:hypothetical protein
MDLQQRKLKKSEWDSIEVPVSKSELDILNLIMQGYHNVNVKINNNHSIFTFLKIEFSEKMENYLYNKYLRTRASKIEEDLKKIHPSYKQLKLNSEIKINSADKVRLERFDESLLNKNDNYEFLLLNHLEKLMEYKKINNQKLFHYHYYTLYKLIRNNIVRLNKHIIDITNCILNIFEEEINKLTIIENGVEFIERNESLLKYSDLTLYEHQKEIFTICKNPQPKLILYMAPTGTGKTLTPIALSEQKKIIFVCAARHVGLALAKAAISVRKKIAFAFGCSSADDIRLHYYAAKVFTRNKRTGGIKKVDNSVGDNVEIMICDISSYLPAMYYMLAFFKAKDIIMYWDEPTITLDYDDHNIHNIIRRNWKKNKIPNIVLSSATLPKQHELTETLPDFLMKFSGAEIFNIVSHDCKKSIPIISKDGFVVLPHYLSESYEEILKITQHCSDHLTMMRYFDLKEVIEFIRFIIDKNYGNSKTHIDRHFETLENINMKNIKMYYLILMQNIIKDKWSSVYTYFKNLRRPRILENTAVDAKGNTITKIKSIGPGITISNTSSNSKNVLEGEPITRLSSQQQITSSKQEIIVKGTSGAYVTTKDAYTLTDGPTIFISNDVEKIAKFCIQQANIPSLVMDDLMKKIEYNNVINERLHILESELEDIKEQSEKQSKNEVSSFHNGTTISGRNKGNKDSKKSTRNCPEEMENRGKLNKFTQEINSLREMVKSASLNDAFIPNKKMHLDKWTTSLNTQNAFTSHVDEQIVCDIMALKGVENSWKVLLMMGIGVFINHENIAYTEIMKKLADEQKLYMIIASSDYIYGTNYQFCHGFLSKDLNLTQEKLIQAMGRIGRNNIQQTYTIRFRDDEQIAKLFTSETEKPEIINMNRLFNTKKVIWQDNNYVEVEDYELDEDETEERELEHNSEEDENYEEDNDKQDFYEETDM